MRIAVVGSREFDQYETMKHELYNLFARMVKDLDADQIVIDIISGCARGADTLAEKFAHEHGLLCTVFKPDYMCFGIAAPLERNKKIAQECDILVAFLGPNGLVGGTKHVVNETKKLKKQVHVHSFSSASMLSTVS